MKTQEYEGVLFTLGKNAIENFEILDSANPEHYFFHLSSFSSGYVCAHSDVLTPAHIMFAAEFCKSGTKLRTCKDIKVDYCKFSNLIKGDELGVVIFKSKRKVSTIKV